MQTAAASNRGRLALPLWHETYAAPLAPTSRREMKAHGWDAVDVVFVTGDAYVDHPSFAMAILRRVLEQAGFRVAILSQPDWHICEPWRQFGRPRLFFADQRRQHGLDDQPLHRQQKSPQRRRLFPRRPHRLAPRPGHAALLPSGTRSVSRRAGHCRRRRGLACVGWPITITGATPSAGRSCSTRRPTSSSTAWASKPSSRSRTDWPAGKTVKDLRDLRGVAYALGAKEIRCDCALRSIARVSELASGRRPVRPTKRSRPTRRLRRSHATDPRQHEPVQRRRRWSSIMTARPSSSLRRRLPLTQDEMDRIYDLPYTRRPHPSYTRTDPGVGDDQGLGHDHARLLRRLHLLLDHGAPGPHHPVALPGIVLNEVRKMAADPEFKGVVSDIGGPTANMYQMRCTRPEVEAKCKRLSCVHPTICKLLGTDHGPLDRADEGAPARSRASARSSSPPASAWTWPSCLPST